MSDGSSADKKPDSTRDETVEKLKEDLGKAGEKIEEMEGKIEEQQKKTASLVKSKSEGTTLVLSIVVGLLGIMGVGHIYVGRVRRGIVILVIGVTGWIVIFIPIAILGFMEMEEEELENLENLGAAMGLVGTMVGVGIGYLALFIWQILNSRKLCREYNEYLEQHSKPPW